MAKQNSSYEEILAEDNQGQESSKGAHGNTRLPFGLCERYGISLPDGATPRDAWDALKDKTGITPEKAYNDLKNGETPKQVNTGKVETKTENITKEEPKRTFIATRHSISEETARRAKEAVSFSDYQSQSATNSYNADVSRFESNVNELIERYKNNQTLTEDDWNKVQEIAERYSSNLANFTNEYNRVDASYPSWIIAGPARYNTRKNDAKHSRLRSLYEQNERKLDPDDNIYLTRIKDILSNASIKSNDSNAIGKLQQKYDTLKAELENGKRMNAYFRKNKTLVGFDGIDEASAKEFDRKHNSGDYFSKQPYPSYSLANGNAELRRIQGRIDELKKAEELAAVDKANPEQAKERIAAYYPKVDGVDVEENSEQMRVQLRFPGKPSEKTRSLLKSWGFRWSPTQEAWQRQLTGNGKYAAKQVMETLAKGTNNE